MKLAKFIKAEGIDTNLLPSSTKKKIQVYNETIADYKELSEEYEENDDEELGNELSELERELIALENTIIKDIVAFQKAKKSKETATPQSPQNKPNQPSNVVVENNEPEEKKSGIGWLVGGILLVASLGAYNYFKENKK
jgi:hypothetical protein